MRAGDAGSWAALAAVCAAAALAYLLFVNLTRRKLGAPLIAAVLFAAHPETARTLAGSHGWSVPAGTALALLAGSLLARTPIAPRLLVPAIAAYAASLPLAPAAAPLPFLVAAAVVGYQGLEPARLLGKRLLPRFLWFLAPLAVWTAGLALTAGLPAPDFRRAAVSLASFAFAWQDLEPQHAAASAALAGTLAVFGLAALRRAPKVAWPALAAGAALVAGALLPDAWGSHAAPLAATLFFALALAEGLESLHYAFGGCAAMPLLALVYAALAALSHRAAP